MHVRATSLAALAAFVTATCASSAGAVEIGVVGDSEKLNPDSAVQASSYAWDGPTRTAKLYGARNEVVAFQVVLKSGEALAGGDVKFADLTGPGRIPADSFTAFLELYQLVTRGIGRPGDLPTGKEYPDPLVPLYDPYAARGDRVPVAAPFKVEPNRNTIIWVDCWIPPDAPAGVYRGAFTVILGGADTPVNIDLTVWDFAVPAQPHVYNFTEVYRWEFEYHEKAKYGFNESGWEKMKRYDAILLEHRLQCCLTRLWPEMKFADDGTLASVDWTEYDKYAGARLDGTFLKGGPTGGARPALWYFQFAPIWPNNPELKGFPLNYRRHGAYEENLVRSLAREVAKHWKEKGWTTPVVVAVLDESTDWDTIRWAASIFHEEGPGLFKYMNTGHYGVEPRLIGCVDIWSPNAENYDPREMALRIAGGDMTWFYHWREPWIGHMVINTYGISMRTWDAAAFKYGVDGTFLWTATNWPHPDNWRAQWGPLPSPYVDAAGANGGERFGNGTYIYPGADLPDVGFRAIEGPVPSLRLKVMRRGAQEYEYLWTLKERGRVSEAKAKRILSKVMRSALKASSQLGEPPTFAVDPALPWTKAIKEGEGDWSHDAADWEAMRAQLARAIVSPQE